MRSAACGRRSPRVRFSYRDAAELPEPARAICDALLSSDEPFGDVLADEWAFVTSQSLAVFLAEKWHAARDAFKRAGAEIYTVSNSEMKRGLRKVRSKLPPRFLKVAKPIVNFPRRPLPKFVAVGGAFALGLLPHLALPLGAAGVLKAGAAVIVGDP
jgi:hypothetical protein